MKELKINRKIVNCIVAMIVSIIIYNKFDFSNGQIAFQSCALSTCLLFINSVDILYSLKWRTQDKVVKRISVFLTVFIAVFFSMTMIVIFKMFDVLLITEIDDVFFIGLDIEGNFSYFAERLPMLPIKSFCGFYCIMYIALPILQLFGNIIDYRVNNNCPTQTATNQNEYIDSQKETAATSL